MVEANGKPRADPPKAGASPAVLLGIALALLVGYAITLIVLFKLADNSNVSEPVWSRYIYLLGGLEAVVFTAVGWLFGREVNRKQAEQAEKATDEATEAKKTGEGLKQAVLVTTNTGQEVAGSPLGELRALAQKSRF